MFNKYYAYISKKFVYLFGKSKGGSKHQQNNTWNKFLLDIYTKTNYTIELELIKNKRALEWLEVKDREAENVEFEIKLMEEKK